MQSQALRTNDAFRTGKVAISRRSAKTTRDDEHYEFIGGAKDDLRRKHYDKSLRLLWKGRQHAQWSSFRDCTAEEKLLMTMAEKASDAEDRKARRKIGSQEYRDFLKQTYTERERQAIVNILSLIGHGEAYAWLASTMPGLEVLLYVEEDPAEIGVDLFEFGGSMLRKLTTLAERSGFMISGQGEALEREMFREPGVAVA